MQGDGYFDAHVAATYDEDIGAMSACEAVDPAVDFLADLVGEGCALEFGIGTGRVALPLTKRGFTVHGIEQSRAMFAKLAEKPSGAEIPVTMGNFASAATAETYSLVFLVFNTIMNLTSQESQVACFRNAAAHLEPEGSFVVEVMMPRLGAASQDTGCHVFEMNKEKLAIDEYDVSTQSVTSHHVSFAGAKINRLSIPFRYVWPAELDLMAQLAGLTLRERWGNWMKDEFTNECESHISVWTKPA